MSDTLPFTVAVIDDDSSIRRLVRLYLERNGFGVLEAVSGADARLKLDRNEWDLAILDRRLPDIDGIDLCHELKSRPAYRNRYIIVLTADDEQSEKLEGFELGADDYITKPFQPPELLARVRAAKRIVDLQKELIATNRRLERLSITDGLTQLYNHRYFQEALARAFEEADRYHRPLSLALIDLDHFKQVNDTWGHAAGDEVLKMASSIFRESIRGTDIVARYGGEEFAVLMPETTLDDASSVAEKIRNLIENTPVENDGGPINVTVSLGVASFPHTKLSSPFDLIETADRALYRAKAEGRNRIEIERRTTPADT